MATSKALFAFPGASGHINPSFPLCRRLVDLGWQVGYLASPDFREEIDAAGGTFFDLNQLGAEFGVEDVRTMIRNTVAEYGPGAEMWALNFGSIALEKLLPMYITFLQRFHPQLVVYCPVLTSVAHFAARHLEIPDVSLLTAAGPGFWDAAFAAHGGSAAGLVQVIKSNSANAAAIDRFRAALSRPDLSLNTAEPLVHESYTAVNLVTTIPRLADPLNEHDARFYESAGKRFAFVGPLMRERAAPASEPADLFGRVDEARQNGQQVVYVSMGTVITSSLSPEFGWSGAAGSAITGKELCHAVYRAVFSTLGSAELMTPAPLVIVSTGSEPDALTGIDVPARALCFPSVPQVELLRRARPALFVTHGGQNSFMESLSVGSPMRLCPGFGDQVANALKAEQLGLGLKVDRPKKKDTGAEVVLAYEAAVAEALRRVLGAERSRFATTAQAAMKELEDAGGVNGAIEILLSVSDKKG